jgi:peptidoglycan/LPS O-acetylase OafA/YrhL
VTSSRNTPTTRNLTWGLIGGLSGFLLASGLFIGGAVLWLFIAIVIAICLAGYLRMDRIEREIRSRGRRRSRATRRTAAPRTTAAPHTTATRRGPVTRS